MAVDTPTGQQAADDAAQLAVHPHWWVPWEQQGLTTTPGFVSRTLDPLGNADWRIDRSEENKTQPAHTGEEREFVNVED